MDIKTLKQSLTALQQIGCTLSNPQRMRLEMSLLKLSDTVNSDQLLFWGKILTTGQPYYIAVAVDYEGCYAFPHKKFYWSSGNTMEFKQFGDQLDQFNREKVDNFYHLPFSGDPNTILVNIQNQQGQQNAANNKDKQEQQNDALDSQQQQKVKIVPKNYTELDRLCYVVYAIQIQCQIFPAGAYRMIQKHELRLNSSFQGLKHSPTSPITLSNFHHFRYPLTKPGIQKLQKPQSVFLFDFLQGINNHSEWSLQFNTNKDWVTVRNLLWQGYVGYHWLGNKIFGGVYYGNGIKSADVPFYI